MFTEQARLLVGFVDQPSSFYSPILSTRRVHWCRAVGSLSLTNLHVCPQVDTISVYLLIPVGKETYVELIYIRRFN